jgi:hypothetical protein
MIKSTTDRTTIIRKAKGIPKDSVNPTYASTVYQTNAMVVKQSLNGKNSNGNAGSSSLIVNN